jgi:hypothetical protein
MKKLDEAAEAVPLLRTAAQLKPDSAEAYSTLASALARSGQLEASAAAARKAIELNPKLASAYANLGATLHLQRKLDESIDCFREGLQHCPATAMLHSSLLFVFNYHSYMVRPESCTKLTGASPVAVSTEAPRSRPRTREEIPSSEWGVKSPPPAVRLAGGEQVRRPSHKRTLQPSEIRTRKDGQAAAHVTAKATDCVGIRIGAGRPRGVEEGMRTQVGAEQERPVPAADVQRRRSL